MNLNNSSYFVYFLASWTLIEPAALTRELLTRPCSSLLGTICELYKVESRNKPQWRILPSAWQTCSIRTWNIFFLGIQVTSWESWDRVSTFPIKVSRWKRATQQKAAEDKDRKTSLLLWKERTCLQIVPSWSQCVIKKSVVIVASQRCVRNEQPHRIVGSLDAPHNVDPLANLYSFLFVCWILWRPKLIVEWLWNARVVGFDGYQVRRSVRFNEHGVLCWPDEQVPFCIFAQLERLTIFPVAYVLLCL